jgi:1-acyl-sn-glycerol-3-phosphate acyltransferase
MTLTPLAAFIGYLFYFSGHLLFGVVVIPVYFLMSPFLALRRRFIYGIFRWYVFFLSRRYLPFLGVYRVREISGLERAQSAGPAVYVVNHRSRMDGPLMLAAVPDAAVVMKAAYGRNILYSSFVKHLDFISVDAGSLASLATAVERGQGVLAAGRNMIVFPEGARSATGRLLPFRDFAFRLSRSGGVPIVPVVLHSDLPFMAKRPGSIFPPRTINFTLRFLEPVRLQEKETLSALVGRVERAIAAELRELDKGTVWEVKP